MTDYCGLHSGDQILVYILNLNHLDCDANTEFKLVNLCKALALNKHSINVG